MLFKYYLNVIQAQMFRSIQMILIELTVLGYGTLIITRGGGEGIYNRQIQITESSSFL